MVLFLFVIMLLGAGEQQTQEQNRWQRPLAIFLGFILAAEAIYVLFLRADTRVNAAALPPVNAQIGDPHTIGEILFTDYLVPFEATGVLLLVAMVGAIVLTRARPPRVRASTVGTQAVGTQAVSPQTESVQPSKGARNDKC
jgi:NADH-quinone oxidoreductase subunit J